VVDYVGTYTILSCLVGSRAYGLAGPDSDHDRRGVYAAPAAAFWPLDKPPTHLDGPAVEQFSWEVERFCALALTANPTVLEVLWSPHVDTITDEGRRLVAVRGAFLSTRVADSYGRYARDQMRRVDARRTATGQTNHKQAMHMIRLLLAGTHVLCTGEVLVDVASYRERLLAIKNGVLAWAEVTAWADDLLHRLDEAAATTSLPVGPDRATIDDLLVGIRRRSLP
jgi:predicted nucleotidyltransferase